MRFDRRTIEKHWLWAIFVLAVTVLACLWYRREGDLSGRWPGGSSGVGLALGVAAGVIFVIEFLYWPRRFTNVRAWRWIVRAEHLLRAHIWLGLLTLPLVILHSGVGIPGKPFALIFMLVYIAVFLSGVFGLWMQNTIPKQLLDTVSQETIHAQIGRVMRKHEREAVVLVARVTDNIALMNDLPATEEIRHRAGDHWKVDQKAGASALTGTRVETQLQPIPNSNALLDSLKTIRQFLQAKPDRTNILGTPVKSAHYFYGLRQRLPAEAKFAADQLEAICQKHLELQRQQHLYSWLHCWLVVHLPLSIALMLLLVLHVCKALYFSFGLFH